MGWFPCECCEEGAVCPNCTGTAPDEYIITIPSGFTDNECNQCNELAGDYTVRFDQSPFEYGGGEEPGSPAAVRCTAPGTGCCWGYVQPNLCTYTANFVVFPSSATVTFDLTIGFQVRGGNVWRAWIVISGVVSGGAADGVAGGYIWIYEFAWGAAEPCIAASPPTTLTLTTEGQIGSFSDFPCAAAPSTLTVVAA